MYCTLITGTFTAIDLLPYKTWDRIGSKASRQLPSDLDTPTEQSQGACCLATHIWILQLYCITFSNFFPPYILIAHVNFVMLTLCCCLGQWFKLMTTIIMNLNWLYIHVNMQAVSSFITKDERLKSGKDDVVCALHTCFP